MKASTGLRNIMLRSAGFAETMELTGMFLLIYSGAIPATADAAAEADNLLCALSNNSTGTTLTFETSPVSGTLSKLASQTWSGVCSATGTATYFRLVGGYSSAADAAIAMDSSSTTTRCIQGTVGVSGADLNLTSTSLVSTTTQAIDYFVVSFPTL